MKNKSISTVKGRRKVEVKDLKPRDVVFISSTSNKRYLVLDTGHPMVLLEDLHSHWAGLYHPVNGLYVEEDFVPSTNVSPSKS